MDTWLRWGVVLLPLLFLAALALCGWRAVNAWRQRLRARAIGYAVEGAFLIALLVFMIVWAHRVADESLKQPPAPATAQGSAEVSSSD